VFGSTVRGEAGPHSDIDLLADVEPGRTLLDLIALGQTIACVGMRRCESSKSSDN
jgi:predicted nucleotidyltransferase